MKFNLQRNLKSKSDILVIPLFKEDLKLLPEIFMKDLAKIIKEEFKNASFCKTFHSLISIKTLPKKILLIGTGEKEKFKPIDAQLLAGKIGKFLKTQKLSDAAILLPDEIFEYLPRFTQALLISQYKLTKYKSATEKKEKPYALKELTFISSKNSKTFKNDLKDAELIAQANTFTKDLINSPSNIVDAQYVATEAKKLARENGYKIAVLDKKSLTKMKWGGLLAVNQGAKKPPYAVVLEYRGASRKTAPIALIGKGIIFDTGGLNLKPSGYIEDMHQDMSGAATVLGIFSVLKKLKIQKNVIGIIPLAENLISADSYKPSDIITMANGKTVEITNTDAEGRIILADAITYATKLKPKPREILTIATLTGAVSIALGGRFAGLVSNNDELCERVKKAGDLSGELAWPLPVHDDYRKKHDSQIADFINCDTSNREAGTVKGGLFLEKFMEDLPWCHIDIGGTAFTKEPQEFQTKGATGHGMRMILEFLKG